MKTYFIFPLLIVLFSAVVLSAQNEIVESTTDLVDQTTSPLMMSGRGGGRASEDQKQAAEKKPDATASNRRAQEEGDPSASVLRDDASRGAFGNSAMPATSSSQQREMPTKKDLHQKMVDTVKTTVGFDAATELQQEKVEAGKRYAAAVSEAALLAKVPEQADKKSKEAQRKLEAERLAHQQGVRRYAWSDRNFAQWNLPGELPEVAIPPGDPDVIVPPEMLHEEAEELGRRLLAEDQNLKNASEEVERGNSSLKPAGMPATSSISLEEQIKNDIIAESLNPENRDAVQQRLIARARANELHHHAAMLAKESRRLREAKAAANEKASVSDEKSSMLSSLSSSIFGSFSKANTVTGVKPNEMPVDLETAGRLAEEAEKTWGLLALEAEGARSQNSGTSLEDQTALRLWKKADQEVLALNKKEAAAKNLQESWEANTRRWQLRVKAEEAAHGLRQAEENLASATEKKLITNDRNLRGKMTDEEKAEASQSVITVQAEVNAAGIAFNQAEQAWIDEALQNESVKNSLDGAERDQALEKLRCSDEAVTRVWFELIDRYSANESQEEPTVETLQARAKQETDQYEVKRKIDLARYFGETSQVGLVTADARRTYRNGNKTAAASLYAQANECEIAACNDYMEVVKQDALKSARKRLPEFSDFWTQRMSVAQAEKQARVTAATFKQRSSDAWADEPQRALERSTAIAAAEESAFQVYQEEERRLNDIETLFIAIIAAKKEALRARPAKAAEAYFAGDPTAWSDDLSAEERENYNQDIREANKIYEAPFESAIQIFEEKAARARYKIQKAIFYPDIADTRALQDAEANLAKLQAEGVEREKLICWAKKNPEEASGSISSELAEKTKEKVSIAKTYYKKLSWSEAAMAYEIAQFYWNQAAKEKKLNHLEHSTSYSDLAKHAQCIANYYHEAAQYDETNMKSRRKITDCHSRARDEAKKLEAIKKVAMSKYQLMLKDGPKDSSIIEKVQIAVEEFMKKEREIAERRVSRDFSVYNYIPILNRLLYQTDRQLLAEVNQTTQLVIDAATTWLAVDKNDERISPSAIVDSTEQIVAACDRAVELIAKLRKEKEKEKEMNALEGRGHSTEHVVKKKQKATQEETILKNLKEEKAKVESELKNLKDPFYSAPILTGGIKCFPAVAEAIDATTKQHEVNKERSKLTAQLEKVMADITKQEICADNAKNDYEQALQQSNVSEKDPVLKKTQTMTEAQTNSELLKERRKRLQQETTEATTRIDSRNFTYPIASIIASWWGVSEIATTRNNEDLKAVKNLEAQTTKIDREINDQEKIANPASQPTFFGSIFGTSSSSAASTPAPIAQTTTVGPTSSMSSDAKPIGGSVPSKPATSTPAVSQPAAGWWGTKPAAPSQSTSPATQTKATVESVGSTLSDSTTEKKSIGWLW